MLVVIPNPKPWHKFKLVYLFHPPWQCIKITSIMHQTSLSTLCALMFVIVLIITLIPISTLAVDQQSILFSMPWVNVHNDTKARETNGLAPGITCGVNALEYYVQGVFSIVNQSISASVMSLPRLAHQSNKSVKEIIPIRLPPTQAAPMQQMDILWWHYHFLSSKEPR